MPVVPPEVEPPPTRRARRSRLITPTVLILTLIAGVIGVLVVLDATRGPRPQAPPVPDRFVVPALDVAPGAGIPFQTPDPTSNGTADWAVPLADKTDIPERTLRAYAVAETEMAARAPGCKLTWATLAGVGRVESHHGSIGGTRIGADGQLSQPIIGMPLDGSPGVRAIKDTDDGRLDGDADWDRAVGAMQFLPTTWTKWAVRASGDGKAPDPQNIDDAALSAARYLCASGGNLATGKGWWKAVLTYNESVSYGRNVFSGADAYARAAADLA